MTSGHNEPGGGRPIPSVPDHEMLRLIGRGSYGEVWLARNIMGALRAVKLIYRGSFDDSRPYEREYAGLKRFEPISRQHPSQIDILHIGRDDNEACFYYVMELADDTERSSESKDNFSTYEPKTLRSEMDRRGPLPASECIELGLALTTALAHLHQNGLVHRDIKPSNIVFVNGLPKLADIGLVSPVDATRSYVGTAGYAPYEGPGTPQADIYSLGKVLYEAATGRDRQEFPELPTRILGTEDQERKFLELNEVFLKACDDDPRARYQTASAMYEDLLALRSGKSLIQLRTTERRFARARRAGIITGLIALLLGGAYLLQARQTQAVKRLADQNLQLAEIAHKSAEENRKNLLSFEVAKATSEMTKDDWQNAIPDLIGAMRLVTPGSDEDRIHRIRWASLIENYPKTLHIFLHDHPVIHCAYSPDGAQIASLCDIRFSPNGTGGSSPANYQLRVFDVASERELVRAEFTSSPERLTRDERLFFSSDGKRLILRPAIPEDALFVFDASDGRSLQPPGTRWLDSVDGDRALVLNKEGSTELLDLTSGKVIAGPITNISPLLGARLSLSNNRYIGVHSGNQKETAELEVYDLARHSRAGPKITSRSRGRVALNRDGSILVMQANPNSGRISRFSVETGLEVSLAQETNEEFLDLVQAENGLWLITRDKYKTGSALRNVDTGEETHLLPPKAGLPEYVFSNDSLFVSLEEGILRLSDGSPIAPQLTHGSWIQCQAFAPNGHELASGSADGTLRIRDFSSSTSPRVSIRTGDILADANFSPDGKTIVTVGPWGSPIRAYDAATGRPITPPKGEEMRFGAVRFSADGQQAVFYASPNEKGYVLDYRFIPGCAVWNLRSSSLPLRWFAPDALVASAEFSKDGARLLTANHDEQHATVWNTSSGEMIFRLDHKSRLRQACFSPDERLIATSAFDGMIRLWETSTHTLSREISVPGASLEMAFSPKGDILAIACGDECVRLWDLNEGKFRAESMPHPGTPAHIRFAPRGSSFVTFTPSSLIRAWSTSGALLFPTIDQKWRATCVEYSASGEYLLSGTDNRQAWLWEAHTGEPLRFPIFHGGGVYDAHFDASSSSFLTCGQDGKVRVWDTRMEPSSLSIHELTLLSELWSNISADKAARPKLEGREIANRFFALRKAHPEIFAPNTHSAAAWHERVAAEAEQLSRPNAVIFHLSQALALDPEVAASATADKLFRIRGEAHTKLERYREAVLDFERAVKMDPDDISNWWCWIVALLGSGRDQEYSEACSKLIEHFAQTIDSPPRVVESSRRRLQIAALCSFGTNSVSPEICLRLLDALHPSWKNNGDVLGNVLIHLGRFNEALETLRKQEPFTSGFDTDCLKMSQCVALAALGKSKDAIEAFEKGTAAYNNRLATDPKMGWDRKLLFAAAQRQAKAALQRN